MPSFLSDGYTFRAGIEAEDGVHDGIVFYYRPMSPAEAAEFEQEMSGVRGRAARKIQAKWLLKKIVKWQMPDGSAAPDLEESVFVDGNAQGQYLRSRLMNRIIGILIYEDAPDFGEKCDVDELAKN